MILAYLKLLIASQLKTNLVYLARISNSSVSHDQLTRFLNCVDAEKTQLERITNPKRLKKGSLLIDDIVIEIPFGRASEGAYWVYSSAKEKMVFGYQMVLLIWTDGHKRKIIDFRVYEKGSKTKIELALELLSYARNVLKLKPEQVLFDSWYASYQLLKRIKDYGWYFITQLRKNRCFEGKALRSYQNGPYWSQLGQIRGGIKVFVVKHGKKYFASNRLTLQRREVLEGYKIRQNIEETFKQLVFVGLKSCQVRSMKARKNHFWMVILAFSILERKSNVERCSVYELKKRVICGEEVIPEAYLKRLLRAA